MQGITQSYYIHDSAQYQAAKIMIKQLDKEEYQSNASRKNR